MSSEALPPLTDEIRAYRARLEERKARKDAARERRSHRGNRRARGQR
jgi:hypothetical protein